MASYTLNAIPLDLRSAITADAQARDLSVNEVVTGILAERYGFRREPSRQRYRGADDAADRMELYLPDDLHRQIKAQTLSGSTMRGLILLALSQHYQLPAEPTGRRPRALA